MTNQKSVIQTTEQGRKRREKRIETLLSTISRIEDLMSDAMKIEDYETYTELGDMKERFEERCENI